MVQTIMTNIDKAEAFVSNHKAELRKDKNLRYWSKRIAKQCAVLRQLAAEYEDKLAINASSGETSAMYDALDEHHTDFLEDFSSLLSEWENYTAPEERHYSSNDWGGVRIAL